MRVGTSNLERLCDIISLMNPHEEYDRHNNCANELYKFLDDASNTPTTPEEVVVWGDELKGIAKEFDVTTLLNILDNTINTLLEKVRTAPGQMKNASEEAVYTHWCGWRESNSRLILGKDT